MLGAVLGKRGRSSLHMASLATGKVSCIKRERVALGKLRTLPLVIGRKGTNEFVIVERLGQVCFMARRAELRRMQQVRHDRLRMPLRMTKNLFEGNFAGNAVSFFVNHYRGNAHLDASIAIA